METSPEDCWLIGFKLIQITYYAILKAEPLIVVSLDTMTLMCKRDIGTFYHMVPAYTKVKTFQDNVTQSLGKIIGYTVHGDPAMCFLNYTVEGIWSKGYKHILTIVCMTAKRLIATNWKDTVQLKQGLWLQIFLETISMESAASFLSEVYNEEQQLWKVIMGTS